MSQRNNKSVAHQITSKSTKKIGGKLKKHQQGRSNNEGCKITEESCNENFKRDCIKVARRYM